MNKDIKPNWGTVQNMLELAEAVDCEEVLIKLEQIKTIDEFIAHEDCASFLFWYACHLGKGRIKAFEKLIAKSSLYSFWYCKYVANCRIPVMEKLLATHAYYAFWYCKYIAECKIPAMEKNIKKDYYWWSRYAAHFKKKPQ